MQSKQIFRPVSSQGQITVPAEYRGNEDGYMIAQTTNEHGNTILELVPVSE